MPFVTVKQARKLTGLPDHVIRKWLREIVLFGDKGDQERVRKKKGKWQIDLAVVDKLAERDRSEHSDSKTQQPPTSSQELFGLPHLDHPLIGLLQRQLINKDQQMERMQNQMDALLERNRELNVMLHKLQQQLGNGVVEDNSKRNPESVEEDSETSDTFQQEEESKSLSEGPRLGFQSREFAQWLRSV